MIINLTYNNCNVLQLTFINSVISVSNSLNVMVLLERLGFETDFFFTRCVDVEISTVWLISVVDFNLFLGGPTLSVFGGGVKCLLMSDPSK